MTYPPEMAATSQLSSHVNVAISRGNVDFSSTAKSTLTAARPLPERAAFGREPKADACPCCGTELRNQRPRVDLNTNNFIFRGRKLPLSPTQAELMEALARRAPGIVTHDTLIRYLWGADEPTDPRKNIQVHVCRLRSLLSPLGVSIINVLDVGYRLHVEFGS